jgi:manganese oxidase
VGDWTLVHYYNEGLQVHPMHLHHMPQLVVAKEGFPLDQPYWADTVNVAPGERYSVLVYSGPNDLDIDQFDPNAEPGPGIWAFHCHILTHAEGDNGLMGMVTAWVVLPA